MNSDLASLSKKLDKTSGKIEKMSEQVEKAKLDLAAAKLNEEAQFKSMKERIKFMYEGGSVSLFEILLTSENMADFLNKAEYVSNISDYDRNMLDKFQTAREEVAKKESGLNWALRSTFSLEDRLKTWSARWPKRPAWKTRTLRYRTSEPWTAPSARGSRPRCSAAPALPRIVGRSSDVYQRQTAPQYDVRSRQ